MRGCSSASGSTLGRSSRAFKRSKNSRWSSPSFSTSASSSAALPFACAADVIVYGHIHRPFVRQLPSVVVANSGSVGLTWDGDPRASYLVIDGGTVEVRRVEYAVERDVGDLLSSGPPYARWLAEMRRRAAYLPPDPSLR
jgi:hypothetical protein